MLISAAEHFVHWLRLSRVGAQDVDDPNVERFAEHDCQCFLCRKRGTLTTGVVRRRRGGAAFLQFLRDRRLVPMRSVAEEDPRLGAFRTWLVHRSGATKQTVVRYLAEAARWLRSLGDDPSAYDAVTIRNIVLDQPASRSQRSLGLKFDNEDRILRCFARYAEVYSTRAPTGSLAGADQPPRQRERGPFTTPSGAFAFSFTREAAARSRPPGHSDVGVARALHRTCWSPLTSGLS